MNQARPGTSRITRGQIRSALQSFSPKSNPGRSVHQHDRAFQLERHLYNY